MSEDCSDIQCVLGAPFIGGGVPVECPGGISKSAGGLNVGP